MSALIVEVVYRGIFQKNLAARIARGIVLSARKSGRWGIAFGRYGDSPQRNGIPAKDFAIVADTKEELEQNMARYEPKHTDVTVVLDDTLSKGVESWAWYGLQPINRLTVPKVRRPGSDHWEEISWDDAIAGIARHVKDTRERTFVEKNAKGEVVNRTPGIAWIGGCTDTNEFNFLQWKALTSWGVPYRDTQARV